MSFVDIVSQQKKAVQTSVSKEWEEYQQKVVFANFNLFQIIKEWINKQLVKLGSSVFDLKTDLRDGQILEKLVTFISTASAEDTKQIQGAKSTVVENKPTTVFSTFQ